jgi:hypothetical protein
MLTNTQNQSLLTLMSDAQNYFGNRPIGTTIPTRTGAWVVDDIRNDPKTGYQVTGSLF